MRKKKIIFAPLILLLIAAVISIAGFVVMTLWNNLIPGLFHGPQITFWQAAGLLILTRILVGGFGKGRHRRHGGPEGLWRRKFREKLAGMTPEEREKFKNSCRSRYFFDEETNIDAEQTDNTDMNTKTQKN